LLNRVPKSLISDLHCHPRSELSTRATSRAFFKLARRAPPLWEPGDKRQLNSNN
jgi:hypothetical protein